MALRAGSDVGARGSPTAGRVLGAAGAFPCKRSVRAQQKGSKPGAQSSSHGCAAHLNQAVYSRATVKGESLELE